MAPARSRGAVARKLAAPNKKNSNKSAPQIVHQKKAVPVDNEEILAPWTPSSYTAFKALLSARLCAAVWSNISDCDETFNYWEPTHYLMYGKGFQTWEYSPVYAIRSYTYLWLYALPGLFYSSLLQSNKVLVFYFLRCLLGLCCACCEVYFYRGVCSHFGAHVGRMTLVFLLMAAGMYVSSTAFLPSTFTMYLTMVSFGAWFLHQYEIAILATAVSSLVGWPFVAILGLPLAYDVLVNKRDFALFLKISSFSFVGVMIPLVWLDSYHYGRLVIAPANIVLYNVFSEHGPDLYGIEPWYFYFVNGFLNFNFVFIAAIVAYFVLVLLRFVLNIPRGHHLQPSLWLCLLPMYLWIVVFFTRPHKEERFLFPVYPLFCLAAAVTVDGIQKLFFHVFVIQKIRHYLDSTNWIAVVVAVLCSSLSISRAVGLYRAYHAPMETYLELSRLAADSDLSVQLSNIQTVLCVGKEWYRFPSSFFLPDGWELRFVRSEFKGQLPKPYSQLKNATKIIPENMNDRNLEEPTRYIDIQHCDYLIDSDFSEETEREPRYSHLHEVWEIVSTTPFLDSSRSPRLYRSFYIPFLTEAKCNYVSYNLLKRKEQIKKREPKKFGWRG
ncbi:alpha-1,2-mannosyltransferase ALG9-like [Limulus polyphemus]|uniref:Mannosyltransferase n=1 Tax=Limulus polyphemus TaxID=6850 RepID=A0ABM1T4U1_LIMPO|nr:alpha-1,2-mannosyltransferase ALG9-like [Limulus polyphemus]